MQRYGKRKTAKHNSPKQEKKCRTCKGITSRQEPREKGGERSKARDLIRRMKEKIGEDSLSDEGFHDLYTEAEEFLGEEDDARDLEEEQRRELLFDARLDAMEKDRMPEKKGAKR